MELPLKLTYEEVKRTADDEAEDKEKSAEMRCSGRARKPKTRESVPQPPDEVFQCYQRLRRAKLKPSTYEHWLLAECVATRRLSPIEVYSMDGKYSFPSLIDLTVARNEVFVESESESESKSESKLKPSNYKYRLLTDSITTRRLSAIEVYSLDGKYSFPSLTDLTVTRTEVSDSDSYDWQDDRRARKMSRFSQLDFPSIVRCAPKLISLKIESFRLERTPQVPPALTGTTPLLAFDRLESLSMDNIYALKFDVLRRVLEACPRAMRTIELKGIIWSDVAGHEDTLADTLCERFPALERFVWQDKKERCNWWEVEASHEARKHSFIFSLEVGSPLSSFLSGLRKRISRSDVASHEDALADTLCGCFPALERFVWKDEEERYRWWEVEASHEARKHSFIFSLESTLKILRSLPKLNCVPGGGHLSDFGHAMASAGRLDELRSLPLAFEEATVCPCVGAIWGNSISDCLPLLKRLTVIGPGDTSHFCAEQCSRALSPTMLQISSVTELTMYNVEINAEAAAAFIYLSKLRKLVLEEVKWSGSSLAELGKALHGTVQSVYLNFAYVVDSNMALEFLRNVYHERLVYVGMQVYRSCGPCATGYPDKEYVRDAVKFARRLASNIDDDEHLNLEHDDTGTRVGILKCLHVPMPGWREVMGKKWWIQADPCDENSKWTCIGDITDEETYERALKMRVLRTSDLVDLNVHQQQEPLRWYKRLAIAIFQKLCCA